MRLRCAQSITTGVIIATIVVLFRNAETDAIGSIMRARPTRSLRVRPKMRPNVTSSAPVSRSAADSTSSAPTVSIDSLAKPANVSAGVSTPEAASVTSPPIRMTSGPAISHAIAAIIAISTASVSQAWNSMRARP